MKKFLKKDKSGFSFIEILVVVAMMAIITVILVPSLTNYVESGKADKDTARMEELVEIIEIALADEEVYKDMVKYAAYGNASCYVDEAAQEEYEKDKTAMFGYEITYPETRNSKAHFSFTDEWRDEDKQARLFAGNMYGVTITFKPENKVVTFAEGQFNSALNGAHRWYTGEEDGAGGNGSEINYAEFGTIETMDSENNKLLKVIWENMGQSMEFDSRTYETSSYTVFIRLSPPLEADTIKDEANSINKPIGMPQQTVSVYGQWNGTYLKKGK
ncbi:MAG: prepilin-type N-terminal cleavage/methylation domain-containing protein [Agathobacter sp.]|nr:prepilin-type N-terminal cleavage/methylation domain-containing protein [Agathobacter sp.]